MVDPGFGIETASLTASWVEALTERQTVGRHVARRRRGCRCQPAGRYARRAARPEQNLPPRTGRKRPARARGAPRSGACIPPKGVAWPKNLPRPARLFARPEKVEAVAELPDHPPRLFVWRNIRHRVAQGRRARAHPWRMVGERGRDQPRSATITASRRRTARATGCFGMRPPDQGGNWWLHGVGEA